MAIKICVHKTWRRRGLCLLLSLVPLTDSASREKRNYFLSASWHLSLEMVPPGRRSQFTDPSSIAVTYLFPYSAPSRLIIRP